MPHPYPGRCRALLAMTYSNRPYLRTCPRAGTGTGPYLRTCLIFVFFSSGCTPFSTNNSNNNNNNNLNIVLASAEAKNFVRDTVQTRTFKLTTFSHITKPDDPAEPNDSNNRLVVYLEGDGHSRESKYQLSRNPTPHQPLALQLAIADNASNPANHSNIVYIARPCQYTPLSEDRSCHSKYWSTHRFAQEVVDSTNEAIDHFANKIKNPKNPNPKIELIGFSGGGGLAVLVAAHRNKNDVVKITTVAGDLDHVAMTQYHHTMPLRHSLNPIRFAKSINHIPQLHLVGTRDPIVPRHIAAGYVRASEDESGEVVKMQLVDASHHEGWINLPVVRSAPSLFTTRELFVRHF